MHYIVTVVFILIIIIILYNLINVLTVTHGDIVVPILRFDNADVPLIEPPTEIVIEGNTHECHKSLTPCATHADCDICREGLANCQYFHDRTVLVMRDKDTDDEVRFEIEPGESYCMALDRERARSCNPHTGIWLLAESDVGFSLLCSCLAPGLVTQLNMYEDCNVPVGCQPNGRIVDLDESPLRCSCDEGHVSDFDSVTQTPFCRPSTVRDVRHDPTFFPIAPCEDGFVRLDHPALDQTYRREFNRGDICVVDPCSIDPISGQRTAGRLMYYKDDDVEYKYCNCPLWHNLFSVYSDSPNMIGESSSRVCNACIQPFNVNIANIPRIDYKFFWAQLDQTRSDDEVIANVRHNQLSHPRYVSITYPIIGALTQTANFILKFSTAYSPLYLFGDHHDVYSQSLFERYNTIAARTSAPCLFPGEGRCITVNPNDCIRRHNRTAVGTAETLTNSWCLLSREGQHLRIWSPATRYRSGQYPVALLLNVLFGVSWNNRDFTTVHIVYGNDTVTGQDNIDNLANLLNTYRNYSIN
ncbi:pif1 [Hemileuca sp. nucleopolyhedrovirus]|uniref:Pif1 n=1 Tax=Hemileuca sp. nucleopolyhedrovirus TaxID=1367203 RepID=S5N9E3_9ABAC|nr:pif1 [Hemileuca sp. nucleopolyhedrovirus]AGR56872.1 pif1 [Hemileuca sp. nucleopolyhedrovirus]